MALARRSTGAQGELTDVMKNWLDSASVREEFEALAKGGRYVMQNVRLSTWLSETGCEPATGPEFSDADLLIERGRLAAVAPAAAGAAFGGTPRIDACGRLALPPFVDCHTHLDKGHISPRTPGADGSFRGAMAATTSDRAAHWTGDDLAARMDFGLRCAPSLRDRRAQDPS